MNDKKREITDWEKAECQALKALVDAFNAGKSRRDSLTQGKIADRLEISQGAVSSYLNGYNALNARVASVVAGMLGCPVESFSPRLAKEIAAMAQAVQPPRGTAPAGESQGHYAAESGASGSDANRSYQGDLYQAAHPDHRRAVDEIADKMLSLTPEQALKLKQAMDLLMPSNEPRKD